MEETAFYAIGIALVVIALVVAVIGLRSERFPTTRLALAGGVGLLLALVAATTTSAVILAREEQRHRNEEAAHEEQETATEAEEEGESPKQLEDQGAGGAAAETGALSLEADAGGALAFDTDSLEAGAGEVTIALENPAAIEHDVAIERDGEEVAKSDLVSEGTTEVTAELEPGEYVFYCSVPGHREGGMEGTLTVK